MAFQFYCPQGHLLEAQESQVGAQGQCPLCGQPFVIPNPAGAPSAVPVPVQPIVSMASMPEPEIPSTALDFGPAAPKFDVQAALNFGTSTSATATGGAAVGDAAVPSPAAQQVAAPPAAPAAPPPPKIVHIPCPKGHQLETPEEMFGLEAQCPVCSAQFVLKLENSVEFLAEQAEKDRLHDERLSRFWLKMAIWIASLSVLAAVGAIVYLAIK